MSDYAKCYTITNPRARKQHRCCECYGIIEPGEKYHVFKGVWDVPMTFKTCSDCERERENYKSSMCIYDILCFEGLYEDLSEWRDEDFMRVVTIFKERRRKPIPKWMEIRELEIKNEK